MNEEKTAAEFDHWPLAEEKVALRRHIPAPDGSDKLEFVLLTGDGEVEGVKFDMHGTAGMNIEVLFKVEGAEYGEYRYIVKARDVVAAAYEQFKRDREET